MKMIFQHNLRWYGDYNGVMYSDRELLIDLGSQEELFELEDAQDYIFFNRP